MPPRVEEEVEEARRGAPSPRSSARRPRGRVATHDPHDRGARQSRVPSTSERGTTPGSSPSICSARTCAPPTGRTRRGAKVAVVRFGDERPRARQAADVHERLGRLGQAARRGLRRRRSPSSIVVHDDIDLPAGDVRVKRGGGHGGHNGLRSLHEKLGSRRLPARARRASVARRAGWTPPTTCCSRCKGEALGGVRGQHPDGRPGGVSILDERRATMQEYNAASRGGPRTRAATQTAAWAARE